MSKLLNDVEARNKVISGLVIVNRAIVTLDLPASNQTDEFVIGVLKDGNFIDLVLDGPDDDLHYVEVGGKKFTISYSGISKPVYQCQAYSLLQSKVDLIKKLGAEIVDICDQREESVEFELFNSYVSYDSSWVSSSQEC